MHFFKNSVSFIAVMCVFGAAVAAVAPARGRVGVVGTAGGLGAASRRLPSLINIMRPGATTTTTTTTTTTNTEIALVDDQECVDTYRKCMKGANACDANFEECTTTVLFHGHMGECFSSLYQCSDKAITDLFGDGATLNNLADEAEGSTADDTKYIYPTASSILGMDISGAAIRNKLSTEDCVKKYQRCLKKDTICGEDFELCTNAAEFARQATMCDSTLSRCPTGGFQSLFGNDQTTKPILSFFDDSTLAGIVKQWVDDGAALAASNAVNTCYKVIDSCFTNACKKNPYHCVEGVSFTTLNAADWVGGESTAAGGSTTSGKIPLQPSAGLFDFNKETAVATGTTKSSDVRKFFRGACEQTVGGNKYCFMTFRNGKTPTRTDLLEEDNQADVFDDAYTARKTILNSKVQDAVAKFNKDAQDKCLTTFKSCVINSCGGGSGAACYSQVFGTPISSQVKNSVIGTINGTNTYDSIQKGCQGIVDTDANCIFMAALQSDDGLTGYSSVAAADTGAFEVLFPLASSSTDSQAPIVAALNADLSAAYNDVAIAKMKRECQTYVENCAKSMCGKDYQNCYRNRSDIFATTYSSSNQEYNDSMNKMGGVLDYTVVQGLCASTVRTSDVCAESLAMAKIELDKGDQTIGGITSWGGSTTVANAWRQSGAMAASSTNKVQDIDANGKRRCECTDGTIDICGYETGATNTNCTKAHMVDRTSALDNAAVATVFQDVLDLVEREAQALYKAKLTKEQNICLAQNGGTSPNPTYVWAKLKGKSLSGSYEQTGLTLDEAPSTNDLYGGFCRIRVDLRSDDKELQEYLSGAKLLVTDLKGAKSTAAYFAAGDTFQCGSWLSSTDIETISKLKAQKQTGTNADGSLSKNQKWGVAGISILSSAVGIAGTDLLQTKTGLGGLLKTNSNKSNKDSIKKIDNALKQCQTQADRVNDQADKSTLTEAQKKALSSAASSLRSTCNTLKGLISGFDYTNCSDIKFDVSETDASTVKTNASTLKDKCDAWLAKSDDEKVSAEDGNVWNKGLGRGVVDVIGGGITGAAGGVMTAQIMKAQNRAKFTEAQEEWMENVGSKIHCYVNGEQVGSFGDVITINIDAD